MKCEICEDEFDNYRALNGHKRMHGTSKGSRKCTRIIKYCLVCDSEMPRHNKKYCSNSCQQQHIWEDEKIKIENNEQSSKVKLRRYLEESIDVVCDECGIGTDWNNKFLMLQLDHIDGDNSNNILSNIRLLCPNCHTQTATWGYKKRE